MLDVIKGDFTLSLFLISFFCMVGFLFYQTMKELYRPDLTLEMAERTQEFRGAMSGLVEQARSKIENGDAAETPEPVVLEEGPQENSQEAAQEVSEEAPQAASQDAPEAQEQPKN